MPRAGLIYTVAGLWALLFVFSFVAFAHTEPLDIGFVKGFNRVGEWMKWQSAALVVAAGLFLYARNARGQLTAWETRIAYGPLVTSGAIAGFLMIGFILVLF
jgi:hypothetical protein